MEKPISVTINSNSPMEEVIIKNALETIAKNFDIGNLKYLAELSKKPNANKKFTDLQTNKFVNALLK